jgi:hypothetical protein
MSLIVGHRRIWSSNFLSRYSSQTVDTTLSSLFLPFLYETLKQCILTVLGELPYILSSIHYVLVSGVFFFYLVGWDLTPIRSLCRSPRFV